MLPLAADENLNNDIVRAVRRRPQLSISPGSRMSIFRALLTTSCWHGPPARIVSS